MLTTEHIRQINQITQSSNTPEEMLSTWSTIIGTYKCEKYLEVGSFEGRSAALFTTLAAHYSKKIIQVTCIDSWQGGDEHKASAHPMHESEQRFDQTAQLLKSALNDQLRLEKIKGFSSQILADIFSRTGFYDLIYVDAGHKSKEVLRDLVMAWPLLKEGGIMIIDDYTWTAKHEHGQNLLLNSPRMGINAFVDCHADEITLLSNFPLLQLHLLKQHPLHHGSWYVGLRYLPIPEIAKALQC